jgi:hypothetical protein
MHTYHVCVAPLAAESTFDPAPIPWLRTLTESMAFLLAISTYYLVVDGWFGPIALHVTSLTTSEA